MFQLKFLEASYYKAWTERNANSYKGPFVLDYEYQSNKRMELFSKLCKQK